MERIKVNHPNNDLEQPSGNSPAADETCGWCENLFDAGIGATRDVDGKPLLLCPDCVASYGQCDSCDKFRPGIQQIAIGYGEEAETGHVCHDCHRVSDERGYDEEYEKAAARARSNDFADTDGKDWT